MVSGVPLATKPLEKFDGVVIMRLVKLRNRRQRDIQRAKVRPPLIEIETLDTRLFSVCSGANARQFTLDL